jgi:hypothetical protein
MTRFSGGVERFTTVDARQMTDWIQSIPLTEWPQQTPVPGEQPAMVSDPDWFGFGSQFKPLVDEVMQHFPECSSYQHMLSAVMPGREITPHKDQQADYWLARVHVPLTCNDQSFFICNGKPHHMTPGYSYLVNTLAEHAVTNDGKTPRIHAMFDVRTWR